MLLVVAAVVCLIVAVVVVYLTGNLTGNLIGNTIQIIMYVVIPITVHKMLRQRLILAFRDPSSLGFLQQKKAVKELKMPCHTHNENLKGIKVYI